MIPQKRLLDAVDMSRSRGLARIDTARPMAHCAYMETKKGGENSSSFQDALVGTCDSLSPENPFLKSKSTIGSISKLYRAKQSIRQGLYESKMYQRSPRAVKIEVVDYDAHRLYIRIPCRSTFIKIFEGCEVGVFDLSAVTREQVYDNLLEELESSQWDKDIVEALAASRKVTKKRRKSRCPRTLKDYLWEVLDGKSLTVAEATQAVLDAGYLTKSNNFRAIVNTCLHVRPEFQRVARATYTVNR